jgi:hypothetical protein
MLGTHLEIMSGTFEKGTWEVEEEERTLKRVKKYLR